MTSVHFAGRDPAYPHNVLKLTLRYSGMTSILHARELHYCGVSEVWHMTPTSEPEMDLSVEINLNNGCDMIYKRWRVPIHSETIASKIEGIYDFRGRRLDPETGTLLDAREETQDSIFYTNRSGTSRVDAEQNLFLADYLRAQSAYGDGSGTSVVFNITPHPDDEFKPPSPPPPEMSRGFRTTRSGMKAPRTGIVYRTTCAYCYAILRDRQRERGYRLSEIVEAAAQGCGTCHVIQQVITEYADLIFGEYDSLKVFVRQTYNKPASLLSQTKKVFVVFDEYGGQSIVLNFDAASQALCHLLNDNLRGCLLTNTILGSRGRIWDTSSHDAVQLIRGWLDKCTLEHPQCSKPSVSQLPLRVLDVRERTVRLIDTNKEKGPYVALSHCWGQNTILKLTSANIDTFERDIPWSSLSKTFQDTIMLTWKLGFRYLWIDALCILQDSKEDWERHASQMASIFSNSQLTISATRGTDGRAGLFTDLASDPIVLGSYNSRKMYSDKLWPARNVDGVDRDGRRKTFVVRLEREHGLYHHNRPKEPLLKRAWVFQEQILSSRIVHFASGELCFECKSHLVCECTDWSPRSDSSLWETRWRKAHSWLLNPRRNKKSQIDPNAGIRHDFEAYRTLVERYSELEITAELDRLPALSGVASGREDEYLAGMWRSLLLESLHWRPRATTLDNIMARRPWTFRGPTWSWVSMEAPIRHFEFSLNKWEATPVAKILDVSCTAEGLDPRGRLTGGYLRITGPTSVAQVIEIVVAEPEISRERPEEMLRRLHLETMPTLADSTLDLPVETDKLVTYAILRQGKTEIRAYLDCPLALCRSEPTEIAIGETVTCLLISSTSCLVLKKMAGTPGVYRRAGYFVLDKDGWSFSNDRRSIVIL